jgi:superfamily II DNA or RNA helicase
MYDSFQPHLSEFEQWLTDGYPTDNPKTREFLDNLLDPTQPNPVFPHIKRAILRAVFAYEKLGTKNQLLNIVTGGGKTAAIAAIIAWLKMAHGMDKFLILVPNLIVRDRLEADFTTKRIFTDYGLFPKQDQDRYLNELDLMTLGGGGAPQDMLTAGIILGNIQQFYESNITGRRNLAYVMNYIGDIAVFNDEAHNTPAPEYTNVLATLSKKCRFRLDTTGTPDRADAQPIDSEMIFHYDINQGLDDHIIKSIVVYHPEVRAIELIYTNPETGEKRAITELDKEFEEAEKNIKPFQWVLDPEPMKKQIALALDRLKEQKRRAKGRYKPLLFVVTMSIAEGERAQKVLQETFKVRSLLVTEESDEEDREDARDIGKPDSPYDAVVSVMMLREGWDVKEVSVILLLRKFSSPVYGQQVIGRGLRRIIRDPSESEILAVVDHPRLQHDWLWRLVSVSKIRQNVEADEDLGDEDIPAEPKVQRLVRPENLIKVPAPEFDTKIDFEKGRKEIGEGEIAKNWQELLDEIEYDRAAWTISRTRTLSVHAKHLDKKKTMEVLPGEAETQPEDGTGPEKEMTLDELRENFKKELASVATDLLFQGGFGGLKKGKLYNALMDHVVKKIFKGKPLGEADRHDVDFAIATTEQVRKSFTKPIVAGILGDV